MEYMQLALIILMFYLNKGNSMRVMHSYCLNYNYGDYGLGFGVKNILRKIYNISFFAECNLQGQVFDDYFISILNDKYDLLVIGGGGVIHGAHWPQGWFWLIEKDNIKKLKIPFIIYGVGYNYFKDEQGIPERGISHLIETQKRASFFSVRNDGSYNRLLNQTGIDATVVADPGFWFALNYNRKTDFENDKYIIVQLANDKPIHRFTSLDKRNKFIKDIQLNLIELSKEYKIIFVPHVFDDIEISNEVASGIDNSLVLDFSKYAFDHTYDALGIYKDAEFVLAMRGHGQIIPLGFNVPVISLENHDKHRGLMENYGLGQYNVNILDDNFSENLKKLTNNLINNIQNIKEYTVKKNEELLEDSIDKLLNIESLKKFQKIVK